MVKQVPGIGGQARLDRTTDTITLHRGIYKHVYICRYLYTYINIQDIDAYLPSIFLGDNRWSLRMDK